MIHAFKTADEPESRIVIHRNFDGDHDWDEGCWCRPKVVDADSGADADEIAVELEKPDG